MGQPAEAAHQGSGSHPSSTGIISPLKMPAVCCCSFWVTSVHLSSELGMILSVIVEQKTVQKQRTKAQAVIQAVQV